MDTFIRMKCCNPFKHISHTQRKSLVNVQPWMLKKIPSIPEGSKICAKCRKDLSAYVKPISSDSPVTTTTSSSDSENSQPGYSGANTEGQEYFSRQDAALSNINVDLAELGQSPIVKKKLAQSSYPRKKLKKLKGALKRTTAPDAESDSDEDRDQYSADGREMINQLKEKFHSSTSNSEKVHVLTVLPKSWSIRRTVVEFQASERMVRKAKKLVQEKGIFSTPNPKPGKSIVSSLLEEARAIGPSDTKK